MAYRLSKSRFTTGLQCHRRLWWQVREPGAPELVVDPDTQARFDTGTRVGELARTYIPGGILIDAPRAQFGRKLEATREAIRAGAKVIYEASFFEDGVFAAIDVLHRRRKGWTLTEVKSSTKVKPEYIPDVAVQLHVLRKAGLEVERAELMHLDRECRHPDLDKLFFRADVTKDATQRLKTVPREVKAQIAALNGPLPDVEPGDHCDAPYECPFKGRCWPERPEHHVSTLYKLRRSKLEALLADGYETIHDLDDAVELSDIADRQRRAVQSGTLVVEPGLRRALAQLERPLAYLDFETVMLAIPVWNGCRPYDQVPVQFSCHVEGRRLVHHEWIAEGPGDPREAIARALLDATAGAKTVVTYNAAFERGRIAELRDAVPALAAELDDLFDRIVDLLPIVRDHVYHPDFGGSFSLKSVLPALVPDMGYDDLEVGDGGTATAELERLMFGEMADDERAKLRDALLAYCETDTLAMVRLMERLRKLAA